jgi:tetratricopeptide (TPR) repeat protein
MEEVSNMPALWIRVAVAIVAAICSLASAAGAQETKLERGTKVVAKSPNFALSDGARVIPARSPFEIHRVEHIAGDRVRLYSSGREGDAAVSDVVRLDEAEAYFSAQIKAAPKAVHGYLMRCFVRCKSRDGANARLDCIEAFRLEPRNYWVHLIRGGFALVDGDTKGAFAEVDEAIRLDPDSSDGYVTRAGYHFITDDHTKALADLEEAIVREPGNFSARDLRAKIWQAKGDRANALHEYNEAVRLDRKSADALVARAGYYFSQGHGDKALADVNEAIRLDSRSSSGYYVRATVEYARAADDAAMADLGEAIRIDPKDVQALTTRADYLAEGKNYERALVDLDESLRLDPKNTDLVRMRADLLVQMGDWKRVLADPGTRIELDLGGVPAAVTCICEFMTTGYVVKAMLDLDETLAIDSKNESAASARAAILEAKRLPGAAPAAAAKGPATRSEGTNRPAERPNSPK